MNRSWLKRTLQLVIVVIFLLFLLAPLWAVFKTAFPSGQENNLHLFMEVFDQKWQLAFFNSLKFAIWASLIATVLAFLLAYGNNFSLVSQTFLKFNSGLLQVPMLLPTITYGFVLIYSFGSQGLWGKYLSENFSIYGTFGILLGFVIYLLPPLFILLNNSMQYLDTRLLIVSRLMGDSFWQSFKVTILSPLTRIIAVAFLQGFFMSFTDFGIPTALAGQIPFITTLLYEGFMGTIPDFQYGAMIALTMLLPSLLSICLLHFLQKKAVPQEKAQNKKLKQNKGRDYFFALLFGLINLIILLSFSALFIVPFVSLWPYDFSLTLTHFQNFGQDSTLLLTIKNSLFIALMTGLIGTFCAYFTAIFSTRGKRNPFFSKLLDSLSTITNSIPGMVLGVAYLLLFSGTRLHNGFAILIFVTVVHYFATPYQMAKEALQKLNPNWENTALLMGDSWFSTIYRILLPNSKITLLEMFRYYFINSMVTISAVVFLTSAQTMVITAKLKELQHFGRFTEIFILSLLLLGINGCLQLIILLMRRITNEEKNRHRSIFYRLRFTTKRLQ